MIDVLIVDDSRFNRKTLRELLAPDPDIRVCAEAADGAEAIRRVEQNVPDVITLDLEMPHVDGLAFLRWLMSRRPVPVLVVTSRESNYSLFEALELGALDFVLKPGRVSPDLPLIQRELIEKVRLLAGMASSVRPRDVLDLGPAVAPDSESVSDRERRVFLIAASTGGPLALQKIFRCLRPDLPAAILVNQHMPAYSTSFFAQRLAELSTLPVREARADDEVVPGRILLAPGGWQMTLVGTSGGPVRVRLEPARDEDEYVPSADRLFTSAARVFGSACAGIVLTGMGSDGCRGLASIRSAGGITLAESPETAVVYGMPRRAVAAGVVDRVVPLHRMPGEIERIATGVAQETGAESLQDRRTAP